MGNRKERRRAAAGNSSRRVKLDLFAEPSGDFGGSSAQDEVGGEDDSKNRAGLSNSPSSSGKPQNPLLLLGQYSDDELDDGSKGTNTDQTDRSLGEVAEQAKVDDKKNEDAGIIGGNESVSKKVEEFIMEMDSMDKAGEDDQVAEDTTNLNNFDGDLHMTEQTVPATSDNQDSAAISSSGWKMVLHEESNQYYYWNIVTGETSWVAPDVLALSTESIYGDKEAIESRQEDNGLASKHINSSTSDGSVDSSTLINGNNKHGSVFGATQEGLSNTVSEEKKEGDSQEGMLQSSYGPFDAQYIEMPVGGVSSDSLGDVGYTLVGYQTASAGDPMLCGPDTKQGEYEDGNKLSYHLMGSCENLLEQLRSMNRSKDDFVLKCMVEIETRLNDIESLASHGSALLPFWAHSEKQILLLKATINEKIDQYGYVQLNDGENAHKPDGSDGTNLIAGSRTNVLNKITHEGSDVLSSDKGQKFSGAYENGTLAIEHGSSDGDAEGAANLDRHRHVTQDETTSNAILHSADDADMDVDMEVEDVINPEMTTSGIHVAPMLPLPSMLTENLEASGTELVFSVPPLPDGDWIPPPPPPDNEPFPPPPPEEPPESPQPPPPGSEPVHMVLYGEQYTQSYPCADTVYYGQTEFPSSNHYPYSDGIQTAISQPSLYYNNGEAAFGVFPVVGPGSYYTSQDVACNPTSSAGLEPSIIGSVSGHTSFCPDESGSVNIHPPASYSILPERKSDVLIVSGETRKACLEVPASQPTVPVTETAAVPSTSAALTSATVGPAAPKGQAKVSRAKKRTGAAVSTLRSNKKVSSLVDKWKAAKEEMLEEEEEEPETYIEKLEKKRQREIEEWRAKQIASGEAKENANFQPLGGDWRERVKRKRAKLAKERDQSPSEGSTEKTDQPDLGELSKGLPSGWQVFWDDSSKQVYYGNTITSETSWTKPSN